MTCNDNELIFEERKKYEWDYFQVYFEIEGVINDSYGVRWQIDSFETMWGTLRKLRSPWMWRQCLNINFDFRDD